MRTNESSVSAVSAVKTKAAAHRLSVSEKTIRDLVRRGLLKPNRSTRHLLFPVEELERFLKA
jgi:excisionase family DNA binding protein